MMRQAEVEQVYEALARAYDAAGPDRGEVFLGKVALLLAHEIGDAARVLALIADAGREVDR